MEMFLVVIQLGAILAVVALYWNKLFPFAYFEGKPVVKKNIMILWFKIAFACIPGAVVGILFDDFIEEKFNNYITVAIMLVLYGILFIIIEKWNRSRPPKVRSLRGLSFGMAFCIGLFQVLAIIPGTSRSGATILGGILLGTSRNVAAEFTFFLAIPVMFGLSFIKLAKFGFVFTNTEVFTLLLGMAVAFAVSVFAIKFLMGYIKKHDFAAFGYYRIILGVIVLAYFLIQNI